MTTPTDCPRHRLLRGDGMAGCILLGTLAAVGLLSILWVFFGVFLPGSRGGVLICLGWPEKGLVERYRWLRNLGLIHYPLMIVTEHPEDRELRSLGCGIEICSPDALWHRLERERTEIDGTGNGDPPGRHQCRGISEL